MGSTCLFKRQQALKMGYFYWLCIKNSKQNHLYTEFSLGNLKDTKFYFKIKASFIKISSIASFQLFLITWLWGFCTFSDSFVVTFKSLPWPKYTKYRTIFQKTQVPLSNFFLLQTFSLLDCSQQLLEKKSGVTVLVSSQTAVTGGRGFEMAVRINQDKRFARWGLGRDTNSAYHVRSMHLGLSLFSVVFMCLISPTQKFRLGKREKVTKIR